MAISIIPALIGVAIAKEPSWHHLGQRDLYQIVVLEESETNSTAIYWNAIKSICGTRRACNIAFFSTAGPTLSADGGRLSSDDLEQVLLLYTVNKGFEWNCVIRPYADNCFSR